MQLVTKTIETKRLILRQFKIEDAPAMFQNWAGDSEATRYMSWPTYTSVEDAYDRMEFLAGQYERQEACEWAIVPKNLGEPIGSLGAVVDNERARCLNIGYIIGKEFWHQGITSEALAAVIEYFFAQTDVNRIHAWHAIQNPHSGGVMKKCGMQFEGIMRQSDVSNAGLSDTAHYAILKEDWLKGKSL